MQHAEDVEEDVELVREPEEAVRLLPDQRVREQEDDAHHGVKHYAWETSIFKKLNVDLWLHQNLDFTSNSGEGPEEPVVDVRLLVRGKAEFGGEAVEVLEGLRGHVVKVDEVHRGVHEGEEEGGARAYLERGDSFQGRYYWWRPCLIITRGQWPFRPAATRDYKKYVIMECFTASIIVVSIVGCFKQVASEAIEAVFQ